MWVKKGLLWDINRFRNGLIQSHGAIPFALHLHNNDFRIFYSSRNSKGQSLPFYIDCQISNGSITLTGESIGPFMDLGEQGTFDDSGIMPICFIKHAGAIRMYYVGWNPEVTVSYRHAIGLAISDDGGKTFRRYSKGPVCDRSLEEPFFNTSPFVMVENDLWRMWYISCTHWQVINGHPEPSYHVKYAESHDGIHWQKEGLVCVDYDAEAQAIGRMSVIKTDGLYKMYFSYRHVADYRSSANNGYKIGLATSADGKVWDKKYNETGIELSATGWDAQMMGYPHVFKHDGLFYMLYNGNGFGRDGFGYAVIDRL
jgi:hypothetical protein